MTHASASSLQDRAQPWNGGAENVRHPETLLVRVRKTCIHPVCGDSSQERFIASESEREGSKEARLTITQQGDTMAQ
ncbi:hypothetical protein chiPu_0004557 [Chiloscyllium punctatum]|uniref:Uncharacterized protein n=1 Tax=Chiloscyllium punctatum TaxID=137246 RepID=A0A401S6X2_CHIPU|nr:hypothetical protein [Chiloscyllium punctatum]